MVQRERVLRYDLGATNAPLRVNDCQFALGFESANLKTVGMVVGSAGPALRPAVKVGGLESEPCAAFRAPPHVALQASPK